MVSFLSLISAVEISLTSLFFTGQCEYGYILKNGELTDNLYMSYRYKSIIYVYTSYDKNMLTSLEIIYMYYILIDRAVFFKFKSASVERLIKGNMA